MIGHLALLRQYLVPLVTQQLSRAARQVDMQYLEIMPSGRIERLSANRLVFEHRRRDADVALGVGSEDLAYI